mgnify:FL=1
MFSKELFAQRLKQVRMKANERQIDLAEVLGVSGSQIVEMENGRKATTFEKLYKFCTHYNISADYLIGLTDEPRPLDGNQKEGSV